MYTIDIILRGNPVSLSVQRKEEEGAHALYREILASLASGYGKPLELTCEKLSEKRVAVLTNEVVAVVVSPAKSGASLGMRAGFFSGPEMDEV